MQRYHLAACRISHDMDVARRIEGRHRPLSIHTHARMYQMRPIFIGSNAKIFLHLLTTIDTHNTPSHVIVHWCSLTRHPYQCHYGEPAIRIGMQQMLAISDWVRLLLFKRQKVRIAEKVLQGFFDSNPRLAADAPIQLRINNPIPQDRYQIHHSRGDRRNHRELLIPHDRESLKSSLIASSASSREPSILTRRFGSACWRSKS